MMNAITGTSAKPAFVSRHERGHANGSAAASSSSSSLSSSTTQLSGFKADKLTPTGAGRHRRSPLSIARLIMAVLFISGVACDSSRSAINSISGATLLGSLQQLPSPPPSPTVVGPIYSLDYSLDDLSNDGNNYLICTKDLCQQILSAAPSGYNNLEPTVASQLARSYNSNSDIMRGPPLEYLELAKKASSPKHTPRFGRRRR